MVLSHTRAGTLVATAFALLMALHLSPGPGPLALGSWIGAKLALALTRVGLWKARQRVVLPPDKPKWRRLIYGSLALDGTVFGVAGFWAMGQAEPTAALVAATLACISCVATFGLQVRLAATAAYVAPILVPTALALVLRGDDFGWVGGFGLLLLLGLTLVTARGAQKRLAANELLKLHAQSLLAEREAALALAQRQSAVKSQFVAKVSHELRTPLHGILGLTRLLLGQVREPEQISRVALIENSGTHLLALINDLLDVSRIESGQFHMHNEAFDLVAEVEKVVQVFAVRATDKGLTLGMDSALPRPCWVRGDPARLRQVLNNLLGNAVKFTQQGGITLRLKRPGAKDMVVIEVQDSGVGIAEADIGLIFQPFAQSARAAGQPAEGAGLGLTIAREIANGMGGEIAVRSQLGRGTTFEFSARLPPSAPAPANAAPSAPPPPPPAVVPAPAGPPSPGALPRQVLVAEDDDVNAMIVMAYLEALGVAARRVNNGLQAVEHATVPGQRPDLVLMDCRMPTLDGMAATRQIRQQEQQRGWPRLPVIALTATSAEVDRATCLAAGMDDFVSKPFTRDELMRALARFGPAAR